MTLDDLTTGMGDRQRAAYVATIVRMAERFKENAWRDTHPLEASIELIARAFTNFGKAGTESLLANVDLARTHLADAANLMALHIGTCE